MTKEIASKTILNKTKRRDPWFLDDYTLNPYSSCSFNCLYCYIRGSKYGQNLATSQSVKINAPDLLRKQLALRAKKGQYGFIVISSATDPYLKIEKEYMITKKCLEIILEFRFPVHIITKSDLVLRDIDLLKQIDQSARLPEDLSSLKHGIIITFSFSSLRDHIGKIFEPGATLPSERLKALDYIIRAGFLSGVSLMPLLPYITDTRDELEYTFKTFQQVNAHYVMPATLTLFGNGKSSSKTLMINAIEKHYPELKSKYEKLFFSENQMPAYYQNAFYKKMKELSAEFKLADRIF